MGKIIGVINIYIYLFIVIYMPPFTNLYLGIPIQYLVALFLPITFFYYLIIKKVKIAFKRNIIILIFGIVISMLYFAFRATFENLDLRILQNSYIIVQVLHLILINSILNEKQYDKKAKIRVLLNLSFLQGIISIGMLVYPEFKNVALDLYYLGRQENIFISRMRIYGISGDYTFFTPIYHSLLLVIAVLFTLKFNRKYFLYVPMLFLVILLNGRFGLFIIFVCLSLLLIIYLFKLKIPIRLLFLAFIGSGLVLLCIKLLEKVSPYNYEWIISGLEDTTNFLFKGELTGNYSVLVDSYLIFPKGWTLIFGEGYRLYENKMGMPHSDIGYVNDLFMGGIVYILLLYGSVFFFILKTLFKSSHNKEWSFINKYLSLCLMVVLLMSNYKGESMKSGLILLASIFIVIILDDKKDTRT